VLVALVQRRVRVLVALVMTVAVLVSVIRAAASFPPRLIPSVRV
jgi:hypothetical protein